MTRVGQRLACYRGRPADLARDGGRNGTAVGSEHHIGVKHRDKCVEVTVTGGSKERID